MAPTEDGAAAECYLGGTHAACQKGLPEMAQPHTKEQSVAASALSVPEAF